MMRHVMMIVALAVPGTAIGQVGDVAKGRTAFIRCAACHQIAAGRNGIGPTLAGLTGRKAGRVPGYAYSAAMKQSDISWTPANLDAFLAKPAASVPGTKMVYMGMPDPADRKNLIAYLATLK